MKERMYQDPYVAEAKLDDKYIVVWSLKMGENESPKEVNSNCLWK